MRIQFWHRRPSPGYEEAFGVDLVLPKLRRYAARGMGPTRLAAWGDLGVSIFFRLRQAMIGAFA